MKKLILSALFTLTFIAGGFAQIGYKSMNGYYQWNGNMRFNDTLFLDSADYDLNQGFQLFVDTTGVSETGYYRLTLDSVEPVGTVKGTGTLNQFSFWAASDSLTSSSAVSIVPDSLTLQLQPSGREAISIPNANNKINIAGSNIIGRASSFEIKPKTGLPAIVTAQTDSAIVVNTTGDGALGIHTDPATPLHVAGNNEILVTLEGNQTLTPSAESATLSNFPTGVNGDPSLFIAITVNGTNYIIPLWAIP